MTEDSWSSSTLEPTIWWVKTYIFKFTWVHRRSQSQPQNSRIRLREAPQHRLNRGAVNALALFVRCVVGHSRHAWCTGSSVPKSFKNKHTYFDRQWHRSSCIHWPSTQIRQLQKRWWTHSWCRNWRCYIGRIWHRWLKSSTLFCICIRWESLGLGLVTCWQGIIRRQVLWCSILELMNSWGSNILNFVLMYIDTKIWLKMQAIMSDSLEKFLSFDENSVLSSRRSFL